MIKFGKFELNNCVLSKYEASKYTHSKFAKGQTSYNLYFKKQGNQEEEDFFIIANKLEGFDLTKAERRKIPCCIKGTILKNPNTHKTIFVIDEEGSIKFEEA